MKNNEILLNAKECLEQVITRAYPAGFSVGSWWQSKQKSSIEAIRNFTTCEEAIAHAQSGNESGFDHRIIGKRDYINRIVNYKLKELEACFPCFSLCEKAELMESSYSNPDSLVTINGKLYSSIFLTHLSFYL